MPSPRVYMTVSRSGQILRPCSHKSSAVLPTTVTTSGPVPPGRACACSRPWRKRAPPTPPERTVRRRAGALVMGPRLAHLAPDGLDEPGHDVPLAHPILTFGVRQA